MLLLKGNYLQLDKIDMCLTYVCYAMFYYIQLTYDNQRQLLLTTRLTVKMLPQPGNYLQLDKID